MSEIVFIDKKTILRSAGVILVAGNLNVQQEIICSKILAKVINVAGKFISTQKHYLKPKSETFFVREYLIEN